MNFLQRLPFGALNPRSNKTMSWKNSGIKIINAPLKDIIPLVYTLPLLWLSLSWDFLRLVDGIQFRHTHTHTLLLLASEYHILSNDDNRDFIGCMCNSSCLFPISKVFFKLQMSFEWFLGNLFSPSLKCMCKWNGHLKDVQQTKTTYLRLCSKPSFNNFRVLKQ